MWYNKSENTLGGMFMKLIRILEKGLNGIINRLEEMTLVPSETLILMTPATTAELMNMGTDLKVETEDPITRKPYKVPINVFSLYTIYKIKTVRFILVGETEWTALHTFQGGTTSKLFSAEHAKNLVILELNDTTEAYLESDVPYL